MNRINNPNRVVFFLQFQIRPCGFALTPIHMKLAPFVGAQPSLSALRPFSLSSALDSFEALRFYRHFNENDTCDFSLMVWWPSSRQRRPHCQYEMAFSSNDVDHDETLELHSNVLVCLRRCGYCSWRYRCDSHCWSILAPVELDHSSSKRMIKKTRIRLDYAIGDLHRYESSVKFKSYSSIHSQIFTHSTGLSFDSSKSMK